MGSRPAGVDCSIFVAWSARGKIYLRTCARNAGTSRRSKEFRLIRENALELQRHAVPPEPAKGKGKSSKGTAANVKGRGRSAAKHGSRAPAADAQGRGRGRGCAVEPAQGDTAEDLEMEVVEVEEEPGPSPEGPTPAPAAKEEEEVQGEGEAAPAAFDLDADYERSPTSPAEVKDEGGTAAEVRDEGCAAGKEQLEGGGEEPLQPEAEPVQGQPGTVASAAGAAATTGAASTDTEAPQVDGSDVARLHQGQADLQEWMLRRSLRKATQGHRRGSDRVGLASLGKATGMYSRPEPVRVWKQKGALAGAVSARKKFKCRTFLFELFTFLITFSKTLELLKFERRTFLSAARAIFHSRGHAMAQRRKVVGKTPEKESAKGVKVEPAEGGVGPAGPASAADDKAKLPSTRCPAGSFGVACGLGACRRRWVPPSESGRT